MRDKDDYGFDMTWLDDEFSFASENTSYLRDRLNRLAQRDADCAKHGTEDGMWQNMPYPVTKVGEFLRDIDKYQDKIEAKDSGNLALNCRFLEVGCGAGVKSVMASTLFSYMSHGIDIRPEYIRTAKETARKFKDEHCTFWEADAWEIEYDSYDVVYMNQMFANPDRQLPLEQHVRDNMTQDAYLISVNSLSTPEGWHLVTQAAHGSYVVRKP